MNEPDIEEIRSALVAAGIDPNTIPQLNPKKPDTETLKRNGKWHSFIFTHDRASRLQKFWDHQNEIPDNQYWIILGEVLTDLEGSFINKDIILILLRLKKNPNQMMYEDEKKQFAKLPNTIPVYRGCRHDMIEGLSWTTDNEKGLWFANRYAKLNPNVVLVSGDVPKDKVFSYFRRRGESEIIVAPNAVINRTIKKIK